LVMAMSYAVLSVIAAVGALVLGLGMMRSVA
jgi:fluoride exporter